MYNNTFYSLIRTYVGQQLFDRGRPLRFVKRRLNRKGKMTKVRLWSFTPKLTEKGIPLSFPSVVPLQCGVGPTSFVLEDLLNNFEFDQILVEQPKTLELRSGFPAVEIFRPSWRTAFHRRVVFLKNIVKPSFLAFQSNRKPIKLLMEYSVISTFQKIRNPYKWWNRRAFRKPKCFYYLGMKMLIPNRYYIKSFKNKIKLSPDIKKLLWYRTRNIFISQFNALLFIRTENDLSINFSLASLIFIHRLCRWLKPIVFYFNRKKIKNYKLKSCRSNFLIEQINLVKYMLFIYVLSFEFNNYFLFKKFILPKLVNGSIETTVVLSNIDKYPKKLVFNKLRVNNLSLIYLFVKHFSYIFYNNVNNKNFDKFFIILKYYKKFNITLFLRMVLLFSSNILIFKKQSSNNKLLSNIYKINRIKIIRLIGLKNWLRQSSKFIYNPFIKMNRFTCVNSSTWNWYIKWNLVKYKKHYLKKLYFNKFKTKQFKLLRKFSFKFKLKQLSKFKTKFKRSFFKKKLI